MMKFTKVERGWYATEDGTYAVMSDGLDGITSDADQVEYGITHEWAAVYDEKGQLREDNSAGISLAWFPTKRQAEAYLRE